MNFKLTTDFTPEGDQPQAIEKLCTGIQRGKKSQVLLGVTGSGKTFTLAQVIARLNRPALVISHNKTLAAQLYAEFKSFFPQNAVEYFVSYYDYYQPEAYIPTTDTYIEKDSSINERLDRLRLSSTCSLVCRRDVIVVASVSCIYNLGSPEEYKEFIYYIQKGTQASKEDMLKRFVQMLYQRNDFELKRGFFRSRGETLELYPSYYKDKAIRILFDGDRIEKIVEFKTLEGSVIAELDVIGVYPAKHFLFNEDRIKKALVSIEWELQEHLKYLKKENKPLEAERLNNRTHYDMEMLKECGICHGIENYSRHLSGRPPGSRPECLIDYFPKDYLLLIDESHVTIPQIRGMYEADKMRKETLVRYGFRLPSCLDNRPLKFDEFNTMTGQEIYVSATPAEYEIKKSEGEVVQQVIRPTGLLDPGIEVRPTADQIEDVFKEIVARRKQHERVLITTLTKRMAEDLSDYLARRDIKVTYLHSEVKTIERSQILKQLRQETFECVVGVNLLREGLDLPEVSLVIILDADKEGFLRSYTSLIQVAGRAARHVNGKVIMYADTVTRSMLKTIEETDRRRKLQTEFNRKNNITPQTIKKAIREGIEIYYEAEKIVESAAFEGTIEEKQALILDLEKEMFIASENLDFERAIELRDRIKQLKGESEVSEDPKNKRKTKKRA